MAKKTKTQQEAQGGQKENITETQDKQKDVIAPAPENEDPSDKKWKKIDLRTRVIGGAILAFAAIAMLCLGADGLKPFIFPSQTPLPAHTSTVPAALIVTTSPTVAVTNAPPITPTPFVCPPRIGIIKAEGYSNYDKVLMELKKRYVIVKEIDATKIRDELNNREVDLIYFPADWADNKYIEANSADFLSALEHGMGFLVEAPDLRYADDASHEYSILPGVKFLDLKGNISLPRKIEKHFITKDFTSIIVPDTRTLIQVDSSYNYKVIGWEETETGTMLPSILVYEEASPYDGSLDQRIVLLATSAGYFSPSEWKLMNKIILWAGHCDQ